MLRITSVLSTPDKQVICIPERSWLRAAAFGTKPYTPEGLVHHMLIRADNAAASERCVPLAVPLWHAYELTTLQDS